MNRFKLVVGGLVLLAFVVAAIAVKNVARKANTTKATSTATADDTTKITTLQLDKAPPIPRAPRTTTTTAKSARETSAALNLYRPQMTATDELIRITGTDILSGTVWADGATDRTPLPGATVSLLSATALHGEEPVAVRTTVSDAQGSYTLTKLSDMAFVGGYDKSGLMLVASKEGFAPAFEPYMRKGVDNNFLLRPAGPMCEGLVLDTDTQQPLEGVTIYEVPTYPQLTYVSDAQGKFTARSVSSPTRFYAFKTGYVQKGAGWVTPDQSNREFQTPHIYMTKSGGATVKGCVIDNFGEPLRGITLIEADLPMSNPKTRTDADGNFTLTNLPAGQLSIVAKRNGTTGNCTVTLQENETREGVWICLNSSISLTGVLLDAADGKPLHDVKLSFQQEGAFRMTTTDENGEFAVRVIATGNNDVQVLKPQELPHDAPRPTVNCMVHLVEPGMEFVMKEDTRTVRSRFHSVRVAYGEKSKHIELIAEKDVPCITGRLRYPDGAQIVGGLLGVFQTAYHDKDGAVRTAPATLHPDGTYTVMLPANAQLTKAFMIYVPFNYAAVVPLTGRKTEHDIVCSDPFALARMEFTSYKIVLSDGTPLLQSAQDNFGVDVTYIAEDGLHLTSTNRAMRVGTDGEITMNLQTVDWPNTTIRITLPDGVVVEKSMAASTLRGKKTTFIYDPVKKDVRIEIEPTPPTPALPPGLPALPQ